MLLLHFTLSQDNTDDGSVVTKILCPHIATAEQSTAASLRYASCIDALRFHECARLIVSAVIPTIILGERRTH